MSSIRKTWGWAGLLLMAALAGRVDAQVRKVEADVRHTTGPHTQVPLRVIGAGRANEGLRADWQAQLATVQKEIGFQ